MIGLSLAYLITINVTWDHVYLDDIDTAHYQLQCAEPRKYANSETLMISDDNAVYTLNMRRPGVIKCRVRSCVVASVRMCKDCHRTDTDASRARSVPTSHYVNEALGRINGQTDCKACHTVASWSPGESKPGRAPLHQMPCSKWRHAKIRINARSLKCNKIDDPAEKRACRRFKNGAR